MEALTVWLMDALLAMALVALAGGALASSDLFKSIVLFIAFGLVMALVWVRLEAPDIALAEAAIGAGVTGALLLAAYVKLGTSTGANVERSSRLHAVQVIAVLLSITLVAATLGFIVWTLPPEAVGLGQEVAANLDRSGVNNPVTAVLLNFRSYDTLLEVMVLLLALMGAWSVGAAIPPRDTAPGLVLDTLARVLAPMLILVAAYLLWAGAHAPGGAFQAGAVLAAAGVLMMLAGWRLPAAMAALPLRLALVFGPVVFLLLGAITLLLEGAFLQFPPHWAGRLILVIEATAMISIGVTLSALFFGAPPDKEQRQ